MAISGTLLARMCLLTVALSAPVLGANETVWRSVQAGGRLVVVAAPACGRRDCKAAWAFMPLIGCTPLRPSQIVLSPSLHRLDTVVPDWCAGAPEVLRVEGPHASVRREHEPALREGLIFENRSLVIASADYEHAGLYTLSVQPRQGARDVTAVYVNVVSASAEGSGARGDDPDPTPPEETDVYRRPHPEIHHESGVTVDLRIAQHSVLFQVGESFRTTATVVPIAHDDERYTMDVVWVYVEMPEQCVEMHVYEACLYHPDLPECLDPDDSPCVVGSRGHRLGMRQYVGCSRRNPPPGCAGESFMDPTRSVSWYGPSGTNLQFHNTPESAAGVYLCIVYVDAHVAAWSYVVVSTAGRYRNVIVDRSIPVRHHVLPMPPTTPAPPTTPGAVQRPRALSVLLGGTVFLALVGVALWVCVICWRARVWRAVRSQRSRGAVYSRIKRRPPYSAAYSSDDSESDSDYEDALLAGPRPSKSASRGPTSGFEILLPQEAPPAHSRPPRGAVDGFTYGVHSVYATLGAPRR
ncbi:envelope glycoprotein E [Bovine alphaherpesvirus 2]|uniref:Envelope glycoprotein E n=1 Tax=Bovine alphaherpesvirus 2 TaxID=10295 RepID=A0A7T1P480_9ALPH|nr:envelope glycoprotein E [Bovine alphaherpesvirus 2]